MNKTSTAAGADDQRDRATATPSPREATPNQQPRPTRRRRSRRRRSQSLHAGSRPGSTAEQPVVASPTARPASRASGAQQSPATRSLTWTPEVELTADLRAVPTEKVADRIQHVLAQVSQEVTLIIWIHDRPDLTPVLPVLYQELRAEGFYSDTTRLPQGGQRMRISRRRWQRSSSQASRDNRPPATSPPPSPAEDSAPR
ncbi:MAG: hypothetical protein CL878_09695 [Dehalococcoidia bacterium]|nr:hypothetical protein [Dehalococcoidia bacterium]